MRLVLDVLDICLWLALDILPAKKNGLSEVDPSIPEDLNKYIKCQNSPETSLEDLSISNFTLPGGS